MARQHNRNARHTTCPPELQRKYALRQINCEKITVNCENKMTEQTKKKTAAYAACIPGKTHILPPEVPEKTPSSGRAIKSSPKYE